MTDNGSSLRHCMSNYCLICGTESPIYANHFFALQFFTYFNESDISLECKTVANYVNDHQNEDWALRLIDASGVVGSGLAKGNYQYMGDFDECLDIRVIVQGDQQIAVIPGKVMQTLQSFSFYSNTDRLLSTGNEKDTIGCFHGFRLISLLFIIIYHIYTEAQLPSANLMSILEGQNNFMLQIVTNAGLWVEAFFLLSGFLCAYGTIRELRKTSIKQYKPITNVIHRYLRLTPSLLGVMGFSVLQEVMASGPQWHRYVETSAQTCHQNWWLNLLYKLNITLWVLSVTLNLCITFLTWPWLLGNSYHNTASVLYGATHRTLWALSWSYILFACATGHGSIVNTVLSWKALVPLSRLSFQAYLYHSVLISRFVYDARQPLYSSKVTLV
ncbi:unnamed protein product [Medioppia subpectinata]|uniref:Nose resistant-to-fluoxetine protein N-terminal domain-containing protein n=1 Tax=Medioppia subpectinata TaxID=1979941 RepID=A0A7R9KKI7_9ACAR|nr:unnamed protein product [Medioppia subpectinata]CAG2105278.1 unnamed protein product [Medioppia subpectinata]